MRHDDSKWSAEEWPDYEKTIPKFAGVKYGTEEYKDVVSEMRDAVDHHKHVNRHHPEFHPSGVEGMTLMDLLEMLCDWKAAGERTNEGGLLKSLEYNRKRFGIGSQLYQVLYLTAVDIITRDAA